VEKLRGHKTGVLDGITVAVAVGRVACAANLVERGKRRIVLVGGEIPVFD